MNISIGEIGIIPKSLDVTKNGVLTRHEDGTFTLQGEKIDNSNLPVQWKASEEQTAKDSEFALVYDYNLQSYVLEKITSQFNFQSVRPTKTALNNSASIDAALDDAFKELL